MFMTVWIAGQDETMADIIAPASGEKIAECKVDTIDDLNGAVKTAREVQKEWAKMPYGVRKKRLLKLREYIVLNADEIAKVITDCTGKTLNDAFTAEVFSGILCVEYYLKAIKKILKPQKIKGQRL